MKIKCPYCGGPANTQWLSHLEKDDRGYTYAVFVVECWSGDLDIPSKYHYFKARIKLLRKTEIDQVSELENTIQTLESQLSEIDVEERG